MKPPDNVELPFFAYGLFKPTETAFKEVSRAVKDHEEATIGGYLFVRDGVPLLELGGEDKVDGFILSFEESHAEQAYARISEFVATQHYKWHEFDLQDGQSQENTIKVNVLVGIRPDQGSVVHEGSDWTAKNDAVFNVAMAVIRQTIGDLGERNLASGSFDWEAFFRLQMAYSLLWMAIERFCRFAYGLELRPEQKRSFLGGDAAFVDALKETLKGERELYDPSAPDLPIRLDRRNTMSSLKYYYGVRNNLSHRGKGEERDGLIVQLSLKELYAIFRQVLDKRVFNH